MDRDGDLATDWDGTRYREVSGLQRWLAEQVLTGVDLSGVRRLLDIGCGDGQITAQIADRVPQADVLGIDPSPRMIGIAPQRPGLRCLVGNVLTMKYRDEFDAIVSFNALHWVLETCAALENIAAALRRPGRAYLVFVCQGPRPSIEDVQTAVARSPRWQQYFADFATPFVHPDVDGWAATARTHGLIPDKLDVVDLAWDFGSAEVFRDWLAVGSGAWTGRLPDGAVAPFLDDVLARYRQATGSDSRFRFYQLRASLTR